jgi:hypothetical protein
MAMAAAMAFAAGASAQGSGGRGQATKAAPTKDSGKAPDRSAPSHELPAQTQRGLLGAPEAAPDAAGALRLGVTTPLPVKPGGGAGESYQTWQSGDRVRSLSSADVRAARVQQAPDLEWSQAAGQRVAPSQAGTQPQEAFGKRAQKQIEQPKGR